MTALGTGAARAEVDAEAVAAGVRVEKIFHYEEGSEVVDELAERGVSLADVWPGLYAVDYCGYFGFNLTLFNEAGEVTREYVFDEGQPADSETFFPAANGEYFLGANGGLVSLEYRGDPLRHTYYNRAGEVLWRDGVSGETYWGYIVVSPDGEKVAYVRGGGFYPQPDSKLTFKDKSGSIIVEHTIPYLGEFFSFSDDGDYFLVNESYCSRRAADFGTGVFSKAGGFLFFLDPDFEAIISWRTPRAVVGGSGGFLYQFGYKVERRKTAKGITVSERLLDMGPFLQVYDSSGKKRWEVGVSKIEWGVGLSADGRLIAYVAAEPDGELVAADLASGNVIQRFPFNILGPKFPTITLSDNGERVCVSNTSSGSSWAGVFSDQGSIIELKADKLGSFHLTADGNYVVFCGSRTMAVFEINLASN